MKLLRDKTNAVSQSVITIGNFDGVHLGHQYLINTVVCQAKALQCPSVLLTFEPNPAEFFSSAQSIARLMRFSEKWNAIRSLGIDYFYCMRFNAAIAKLSAEDFIQFILVDQLGAKKIIIGDDFRFGAKRLGDVALLEKIGKRVGFEVEAVAQYRIDDDRVSSTRVREAVFQADFKKVAQLTHRAFCLSGKVAYGNQIGRTLGFPTANIYLHRKTVPLMGIFVVRIHGLNQVVHQGVASVGYRPTFDGKQIILEVFIFDFNELIYGKKITVEFLHKIRDEEKFNSVDELVVRMRQDVEMAKAYFIF